MTIAIITGVLSSLLASAAFWIFLFSLRPRLQMSDQICRQDKDGQGTVFVFKILNKTRVPLVDIAVELRMKTPTSSPGGRIFRREAIRITKDTLTRFDILSLGKFDKKDEDAEYAIQVTIQANLDDDNVWNEDKSFLELQVHATHSLSGFGKVFIKRYHNKRTDLATGEFVYGNSLEIR